MLVSVTLTGIQCTYSEIADIRTRAVLGKRLEARWHLISLSSIRQETFIELWDTYSTNNLEIMYVTDSNPLVD